MNEVGHMHVLSFFFGCLYLLHHSCAGLRQWELWGPFPDSDECF